MRSREVWESFSDGLTTLLFTLSERARLKRRSQYHLYLSTDQVGPATAPAEVDLGEPVSGPAKSVFEVGDVVGELRSADSSDEQQVNDDPCDFDVEELFNRAPAPELNLDLDRQAPKPNYIRRRPYFEE